jgi:YHS domain-containing protein
MRRAWLRRLHLQIVKLGDCNVQPSSALASQEEVMEKDVVCGMQLDPAKAAGKTEYQGRTYYFCSAGCKAKFDANPAQFAK